MRKPGGRIKCLLQRLTCPPDGRCARHAGSPTDRAGATHRIEAMWISGFTFPGIAAVHGRDRSTVWREVRRNHSRTHGFKRSGRGTGQALRSTAGRRDGLYRWGYEARSAHQRAVSRSRRPRQVKLGFRPTPRSSSRPYRPRGTGVHGWGSGFSRGMPTDLRTIVLGKLHQRWSPRQISGWLADHFPGVPRATGVPRDDLPGALRAGSRRSET